MGLGLALVAAVLVAFAPPASGQDGHGGDGLLPPGDWTEEQQMFLHDLIERTTEGLPAFDDPADLEALGFFDFGVTVDGYDHWINSAWIDDEHILDPAHPESLVFRHTEDGGYELQAAMFFLPSQYDLTNIPEDLAWLPGWHQHPELCVNPDGTYAGLVSGGTCFSGSPSDMPPMMHVWIVDNPCGHRFGGVGVGGLNCDVGHGHGPTTTEPGDQGTTTTGDDDHATTTTAVTIDPDDDRDPPRRVSPRARPVRADPDFTG